MTGVISLVTVPLIPKYLPLFETRDQEEGVPGKGHPCCLSSPGICKTREPKVRHGPGRGKCLLTELQISGFWDWFRPILWDMHCGVHQPLEKVVNVIELWHCLMGTVIYLSSNRTLWNTSSSGDHLKGFPASGRTKIHRLDSLWKFASRN